MTGYPVLPSALRCRYIVGRDNPFYIGREQAIGINGEPSSNTIFSSLIDLLIRRASTMKKRFILVALLIAAIAMAYAPATVRARQDAKVVSFLTTFGGSELDAMRTSLDEFTKQTGILVTVESNRQLVQILRTRIAGGNPPDLALIPQPGTLAELARAGKVKALVNKDGSKGLIDKKTLTDNYAQAII